METKFRSNSSLIGGGILIALGGFALLSKIMNINFWTTFWPIMVVGFGLVFFALMVTGGKSTAPLAIPGSIITGLGLLMFLQNLTGSWESWAYSWTLIIMLVGVGIFIMGSWAGQDEQRAAGIRVVKIGFLLFLVFGALFERMFNNFAYSDYLLPGLLIILGIYLVIVRSGLLARSHTSVSASAKTGGKQ